eukprot:CAMPEP_0170459182 /NCGR_PEP_ID=MMETSP0123-20130129/5964_1 /TAXON_ID=182087 /ORGANISM="Favella ehrenbergii, Strain Fehren 1" /LENGTH=103 /DNA_ID=CAMNT_0010723699 /DNA_START=313 /DNA_END=620 /DNA_ORIENTATION=+
MHEIKERLEVENEIATRATRARKATSTLEKGEREARINRINNQRANIGPTMYRNFEKLDEFRDDIKGLKNTTEELSKHYLMEVEKAAKLDRISSMENNLDTFV